MAGRMERAEEAERAGQEDVEVMEEADMEEQRAGEEALAFTMSM